MDLRMQDRMELKALVDFYGMNSYELSHTCMHLLCLM